MTTRRSRRRGAALVLALIVIVVATALAQAALLSALHALRRVESQQAAMRESLARDALRARVAQHLRHTPLAAVVGHDVQLHADTAWRVWPVGGGWYRVDLLAHARSVAVALISTPPWSGPCAGLITAGVLRGPAAAVLPDPALMCPAIADVSPATFDSLAARWREQVIRRADGGDFDVVASAATAPDLLGEAEVLRVAAGATVRGILWARVVVLGAGATVDGLILARDSLVLGPGALVRADALHAVASWERAVRARPLGRQAALSFP